MMFVNEWISKGLGEIYFCKVLMHKYSGEVSEEK